MLNLIKIIIISDNEWVNIQVFIVWSKLNCICRLVKIECDMNRLFGKRCLYFTCGFYITNADGNFILSYKFANFIIITRVIQL